MNRIHPQIPLLLGLFVAASCSSVAMIVDSNSGESVTLRDVAEACADQDVVFFGEVHTSDECHELQRQLIIELHKRRADLVISMEMFERDVQADLDAYMAGKLPESEFREKTRAWGNWHHYRPIVQFAAVQGLPVLAANAPKELVRRVSRGGGVQAVRGEAHVAKEVLAPHDAYFKAFLEAMSDEDLKPGVEPEAHMLLFYEAQCLRDETMAETISEYLTSAHKEGRRPLVVHLCGNFHSAHRRGTVQRLLRRMPELQIKVIATTEEEQIVASKLEADLGDFHLLVRKIEEKNPGGAHPKVATTKGHAARKSDETAEPDPLARPGLGFKPIYDSDEDGCEVDFVVRGGAAAKAGIEAGDLIVQLAGEVVEDVRAYADVLGGLKVGQRVKVVVIRRGKKKEFDVVVGESNR